MKRIILSENTYKNLIENITDEIYSTPDTIFNDEGYISFSEKDAIPFFLLPNNKIVLGKPKTKHMDYYNKIANPTKKRQFINSVILQGRYWKNANSFSFWKINSDDTSNMRTVVSKLADPKRDGFIFYKDKKYKIMYKDGMVWFSRVYDTNDDISKDDITVDDEKFKRIDGLFKGDEGFVKRTYKMSVFSNGRIEVRDLNNYELLCVTCYQMWTDFLKTESTITTEEFKLYIEFKTNYRHSFDELLDYFHNNMRKKLVTMDRDNIAKSISTQVSDGYKTDDLILQLLDKLNIDDSEYTITYYDNSELPYSYNIKMVNERDKFKLLVDNARTSDKYVIDRISVRKIHEDSIMTSCRIRLKPEYDKMWK